MSPSIKEWEYLTELDCNQEMLNKLGKDRWNLVSVVWIPNTGMIYYFKREIMYTWSNI